MSAISELAKSGKWQIEGVIDLGAPTGKCEICGSVIRYEYTVGSERGHSLTCGSTCGPTLVLASQGLVKEHATPQQVAEAKAEWKRMAREYVENQAKAMREQLPKLLERYVQLNPGHQFPKDVWQKYQQYKKFTPKQQDVLVEILSDVDWEALEKRAAEKIAPKEKLVAVDERIAAVLASPGLNEKTKEMMESFKSQFDARGFLSPKQIAVLENAEKRLGTAQRTPTPVEQPAVRTPVPIKPAEPTVGEKLDALLACQKLTPRQTEMIRSFHSQFHARGSLTEKQKAVFEDMFNRYRPEIAPNKPAHPAPAASPQSAPAQKRSKYAEDEIDPDDL